MKFGTQFIIFILCKAKAPPHKKTRKGNIHKKHLLQSWKTNQEILGSAWS